MRNLIGILVHKLSFVILNSSFTAQLKPVAEEFSEILLHLSKIFKLKRISKDS